MVAHHYTERHLLHMLDEALHRLRQTAGVDAHVVDQELRHEPGVRRPDAVIEINADGKKHHLVVEAKTHVDRFAALGHVKAQLTAFGKRGLLFAPHITAAMAVECRKIDLPFLDVAGNAYLKFPGLHVYVTGEKRATETDRPTGGKRAGTAAALRVIFALLCRPALLNAPYRDIVGAAGVALGAVGWIFFDLDQRGYIAGTAKKRNRRFLDAARLFDEWVTNYPIKLRHRLNRATYRAEDHDWWRRANLAGTGAYWGGEVAAYRLTEHLKPQKQTLYVHPEYRKALLAKLAAQHRWKADEAGTIEILDAFWKLPPNAEHPDIVPPILVYADLVATLDPRNLETATVLRMEHLDDALRKR
jgi:hypothetical protein